MRLCLLSLAIQMTSNNKNNAKHINSEQLNPKQHPTRTSFCFHQDDISKKMAQRNIKFISSNSLPATKTNKIKRTNSFVFVFYLWFFQVCLLSFQIHFFLSKFFFSFCAWPEGKLLTLLKKKLCVRFWTLII